MHEFEIISKYFAPMSLPLNDDVADIGSFIVSKDMMIEDTHFFGSDNPALIAKKLLRCNLSDIAASGGKAKYFMLGLALPRYIGDNWIASFAKGLEEDSRLYNVKLIGGDTTSFKGNGKIVLSLTIFGVTDKRVSRSDAKVGEDVYVTGYLGDSYIGLQMLKGTLPEEDYFINRYYIPNPRTSLGEKLNKFASSSIDISDGLIGDAQHICDESGVGMDLYLDNIPIKSQQYKKLDIINEGDDYELLFTAPEEAQKNILEYSKDLNLKITKIGKVVEGKAIKLLDKNSNIVKVPHKSYEHF